MKRVLSIGLICFTLGLACTASAMTRAEFIAEAQKHFKGGLSFAGFNALCDAELAGDAKGDAGYESEIYANRAFAFLKQGKTVEAQADNKKALELNPQSARATFNQGMLLHEAGRNTEAYTHMKEAAARAGKAPQMQAAFLKKAGEYREAAAISAAQLWRAFDDNEVAAEEAYKGKPVFVRGKIAAITTDMAGYPVISFDVDGTGLAKVNCVFSKENRPVVAKLEKGQMVLIPGMCDGMVLGQVFVKDCEME